MNKKKPKYQIGEHFFCNGEPLTVISTYFSEREQDWIYGFVYDNYDMTLFKSASESEINLPPDESSVD